MTLGKLSVICVAVHEESGTKVDGVLAGDPLPIIVTPTKLIFIVEVQVHGPAGILITSPSIAK
jgi:hypothetical protein